MHSEVRLLLVIAVFTVGEAVRSTCGNSPEEEEKKEEKEKEENHFHLSLHQTIL